MDVKGITEVKSSVGQVLAAWLNTEFGQNSVRGGPNHLTLQYDGKLRRYSLEIRIQVWHKNVKRRRADQCH